ncbi:MAG TPA: AAA family ATPase [Capsulimonadaceae bacterium]|jgi:hypothetical protein
MQDYLLDEDGIGPEVPSWWRDLSTIKVATYTDCDIRYVNGFFAKGELTYIAGSPGCGKTFFLLGNLKALVTGGDFLGKRISKHANCLYIDSEMGQKHMDMRIKAMFSVGDKLAGSLWTDTSRRFRADNDSPIDEYIRYINETGVDVVFIDSLSRIMPEIDDENSNRQLARVGERLCRLRDETGCAIVVLHHFGKQKNSMRGASDIEAHADNVFHIIASKNRRKLVPIKTRNIKAEKAFWTWFEICETDEGHIELRASSRPAADEEVVSKRPERATPQELERDVYEFVRKNPGKTSTEITQGIHRGKGSVTNALRELVRSGALEKEDSRSTANRPITVYMLRVGGSNAGADKNMSL